MVKHTKNLDDIKELSIEYGLNEGFTWENLNDPEVQHYIKVYSKALGFNYGTIQPPVSTSDELSISFVPDGTESKYLTEEDIRLRTNSSRIKEFSYRDNIVDMFTVLSFINWSLKISSPLDFIDSHYIAEFKDGDLVGFKTREALIGKTSILDTCQQTGKLPGEDTEYLKSKGYDRSQWYDSDIHLDDLDARILEETRQVTVTKVK